jgi:hypothetical protein
MDQVVRAVVWIALFGGTGAVVVMALPRIVIWSLEVIEGIHVRRSRAKSLRGPARETPKSAVEPSKSG